MQVYEIKVTNDVMGLYPLDDYFENPKYESSQKGDKHKYFDSPFLYELKDIDGNVMTRNNEAWIIPDIAVMSPEFYISEEVKRKVEHLLDEKINLFESDDRLKKYYYVNIIEGLSEAWDYEQTEVKWLTQEPPVVLRFLSSPFFNYEEVNGKHLFRINEDYSSLYASDEFVKVCKENKFTGINFKLVWDSEGLPDGFEMNPVDPSIKKWKEEMKKKHGREKSNNE